MRRLGLLLLLAGCPTPAGSRNTGTICIPATEADQPLVVNYSETCVSSSDIMKSIRCDVDETRDGIEIDGRIRLRRRFGGGSDDCRVVAAQCVWEEGLSAGRTWSIDYADSTVTIELPSTESLCLDATGRVIQPDPDTFSFDGCGC